MGGVATLNIRNVPEEVVARLKARAARNGDSLNGEVVRTLTESAGRRTVDEILESIAKIRAKIKNPPTPEEIVEGIHQARDERTEHLIREATRPRLEE
jgi:plasmid stability protein